MKITKEEIISMEIISFNSYKGGACRTTTCYNTIPYIAQITNASKHNPIVIIDMDLDSMGMTNMIKDDLCVGQVNRFAGNYSANSLFDDNDRNNANLSNLDNMEKEYFNKLYVSCGAQFGLEDNDSVKFLGADIKAKPVSNEHYQRIKDSSPLMDLLNAFDEMEDADKPCAVIFDCAAGQQVTTQLVLGETTKIVMCMRPTGQFRSGTYQYLKYKIPELLKNYGVTNGGRDLILVPTAVSDIAKCTETETLQILHGLRKKSFNSIDEMTIDIDNPEIARYYRINTSMVENIENMGIPEIERFKWQECALCTLSSFTVDEKRAIERYKFLANQLISQNAKD